MASSMHPAATMAALEVMRAGGNAVDAAIATAAAVAVTSHNWAGVAGESAWLIHWQKPGRPFTWTGTARVPTE